MGGRGKDSGRGRGIGDPKGGKGKDGGKGKSKGKGKGKDDDSSQVPNPNPAQLNSYIKNSWTIEALFETTVKHESSLNHIHLSAVWNSVGHKAAQLDVEGNHASSIDSLIRKTISVVSSASSEIQARQLANIAHGVAKAKIGFGKGKELLEAVARQLETKVNDCNPQEIANAAWAFAKAGKSDERLFSSIAKRISEASGQKDNFLDNFNSQELTNLTWAFATTGATGFTSAAEGSVVNFDSLAETATNKIDSFTTQGLANTAWGFAKLSSRENGTCSEKVNRLFKQIAKTSQDWIDHFNALDLSNVAWAFAKVGQFDAELFEALAKAAKYHLESLNAQSLANISWAFAKAGQLNEKLFAALAEGVKKRVAEFNPQDLANTAWAFAKGCHVDGELFTIIGERIVQNSTVLNEFNMQDLVNTAWAFAKVGAATEAVERKTDVFEAIGQAIVKELFKKSGGNPTRKSVQDQILTPTNMANLAWAFAKSGNSSEAVFSALANSAQQRVNSFTAQELSTIAWAFANAGLAEKFAGLFAALAKKAESVLESFDDEELDNTEWAFSRASNCGRIVQQLKELRRKKGLLRGREDIVNESPDAVINASSKSLNAQCGKIIIAGGGIGGTALAVALQNKGFENITVLEVDKNFVARKQGYGLTIQGYGQTMQALGMNLASDDAPSTSHYTFDSEGHILGFFGEAFGKTKDRKESENSGRFIHIPRQMLRQRILEKISKGVIRWGSKLQSFRVKPNGDQSENRVSVTLEDGSRIEGAILIGCDGIFSQVRKELQLPNERLNYVGLIVVLGIVDHSKITGGTKKACPLAYRRIFETVDGETRIYAMPFTKASTMWQLSFPYSERDAKTLCKDPAALKRHIVERCEKWHEPIPDLLKDTELDNMSGYPVYDRDVLEAQVLRRKTDIDRPITLIGDSAHPMTPFKAQGANQALYDAVLLAQCLSDSVQKHGCENGGVDAAMVSALAGFEKKMLGRSARFVTQSREKAREMHSLVALQSGRKVQREAGGLYADPQKVIKMLRAKKVKAQTPTDMSLDAVVAATLGILPSSEHEAREDVMDVDGDENARISVDKPSGADIVGEGVLSLEVHSQKLWGIRDGNWEKCVLVKMKKNGLKKVLWNDGSTSLLTDEEVQERRKKRGRKVAQKSGGKKRKVIKVSEKPNEGEPPKKTAKKSKN